MKNIYRVLSILITLALLAGCTPAPAPAPTPTPTNTSTPTPTATTLPTATPTATPIPSPTPLPPDLANEATWPADMRAYYDRAPAEWNNPTQSYISDEAFTTQLIQMRRDFLQRHGVANAETMSEQELFTSYVRWGMENKQQIILSPLERINIMQGPWAAYYNDGSIHDGIYQSADFSSEPSQDLVNEIIGLSHMRNHVYGHEISFSRPYYEGIIATLVGVVQPVGSRADSSVDCLMYYERNGQAYWEITNVSFTPEHHLVGEEYIVLKNGHRTVTYDHNTDSLPIYRGLNLSDIPTQQDFVNHLGSRIWLKPGLPLELTASGVEKAQIVIFDIPQPTEAAVGWVEVRLQLTTTYPCPPLNPPIHADPARGSA